ncbi:MAG TPA: (2Fe-2S) ferredoxin domain-containing protein, partial [Catenuloplanes sp.]
RGCLVTVCRGCCCGTATKHPDVDSDAQLAALRERVGPHGRVRTSDCLGPCDRSTVVVVAPTPTARRHGARPAWLGFVLTDEAIADIGRWVTTGGPGVATMPAALTLHTIAPLRQPPTAGRTGAAPPRRAR